MREDTQTQAHMHTNIRGQSNFKKPGAADMPGLLFIITGTSDLQPSTAFANQLPDVVMDLT